MKGDFSRLTFDPERQFRRVMLQQGRVLVDADWNEQAAILLHQIRMLARYVIGPHGPADQSGFGISALDKHDGDFKIGKGPYFVDGILCETGETTYKGQEDLPDPPPLPNGPYLVYLDVWERHLTYLQDGDPLEGSIREVALGGPDTATRTQVVAQVRFEPWDGANDPDSVGTADTWLKGKRNGGAPALRARAFQRHPSSDPCTVDPDARYRGTENRLYRVEVHTPGAAGTATFKWSRENGSVVFPVLGTGTDADATGVTIVRVGDLGRDGRRGLREGDWVEYVDDDIVRRVHAGVASPSPLRRVVGVDTDDMTVRVLGGLPDFTPHRHALLRRWDSRDAAKIVEGSGDKDGWVELEDGVQIQLVKPGGAGSAYRAGDYWLVPARSATGDVEWPRGRTPGHDVDPGNPLAVPPHGVEHVYASLVFVNAANAIVPLAV